MIAGKLTVTVQVLLSDGDTAICLFNRGDTIKSVTVNRANLQIGNNFKIRNVWKHTGVGTTVTVYKANITKHDVVVLRLGRR